MGPKLNDLALGVLGAGQFFAELSVLPIESGWRHRRTAMVTQNAMMLSLSKVDVAAVADRFPELRNRLVDYAEDYEKVEAAAEAAAAIENLSTIRASVDPNAGNEAVIKDQDPLAILKAQLSKQDAKLAAQDAKLDQISGAPLLSPCGSPLYIYVFDYSYCAHGRMFVRSSCSADSGANGYKII